MQRSRPVILLFLFVFIAACNQDASPDDLPETPNEKLAYAIAEAMNHPDAREEVHGAMDASPYNEHKLVFGEFLEKPESAAFKQELVNVLGSEQVLNGLLDELPSMDFYLPYETHRETWEHAKEDLYVAAVLDPDASRATFYHPDGSSETLTSREQAKEASVSAVFGLHPEELKFQRNSMPESYTKTGDPEFKSNDGWRTRAIMIKNFTFEGIVGGNLEFYFKTYSNGVNKRSHNVSVPPYNPITKEAGIKKFRNYAQAIWVHPEAALSQNWLTVRVMEADNGLFGSDDDYGTFTAKGSGVYRTSKNSAYADAGKPKAKIKIVVQ